MDSITKTKVSHSQIEAMVTRAFGQAITLVEAKELTEGYFNTGYLITTSDQTKSVLKIGPMPYVQVMRYEKDIMNMEVHVLKQLHTLPNLPSPTVLFHDTSRELLQSDYFFMSFIQGSALFEVKNQLNETQKATLSKELGHYVKSIGHITSDRFGYILQPDRSYTTWSQCFLSMIDEILLDAQEKEVSLPFDYNEIRRIFKNYETLLDEVKKPSLVHKDLWEGNIFVDVVTTRITGIIDCERALFGDPIMEIDCGLLRGNQDFLFAFLGRTLTVQEQTRSNLYNVYLYLLIVCEIPFRQYPDAQMEEWGRNQLNRAFEVLLDGANHTVFDFNL
jgi:aminoglycoside phosphotransferase (APT) family kinase protein